MELWNAHQTHEFYSATNENILTFVHLRGNNDKLYRTTSIMVQEIASVVSC